MEKFFVHHIQVVQLMARGQQVQSFHNLDIDQRDFAELGDEMVQELGQSKE